MNQHQEIHFLGRKGLSSFTCNENRTMCHKLHRIKSAYGNAIGFLYFFPVETLLRSMISCSSEKVRGPFIFLFCKFQVIEKS